MSKPFGEELLFQRAEAGTLTPDEQRKLAKRGRERLSKIAGWCEQNVALRAENKILMEAIRRLADQDATLSVCDGNLTVTMDATLTDAEREAVTEMAEVCDSRERRSMEFQLPEEAEYWRGRANILRGLLAKHKGGEL